MMEELLERLNELERTLLWQSEKLTSLDQRISQLERPTFCLLYTSPSPRDGLLSRMPSSA